MPATGRLRHRLLLMRSERGMALPTALFAMIASFALASAAVMSSVNAQQGTSRDHNSKEAIAAADAGAGVALLRLNRFEKKLSASNRCVGPGGEEQQETSPGSGWCPATSPESVGGATFYYMVSAYKTSGEMSVVAIGAAGGVSRRINVKLAAHKGEKVFEADQLIGESGIELKGGDVLNTDIGTNGSVVLTSENGKSGVICGDIRKGVGEAAPTPNPPPTCPEQGTVTEGNQTLPPVVPPENIATVNSNNRLARCISPNTPSECETDPYQGSKEKERTETIPWDATHRFINVPKNTSLTLGGKDYFVCGLFVEGTLIMASSSEVRIFFDTPEHCGLSAGATQIKIGGSGNIQSTALQSSACAAEAKECKVPGLYVMGSPTIPTSVDLGGNVGSTNEVMLYAPYSEVTIHGNVTWVGMFAGKTVKISGNATIKADARIPLPEEFFPGLLERTRYVECTGAAASPPDASC
jgi:hypothetical protein